MFTSLEKHCASINVNHTMSKSNESFKVFNTLRRKSMLKKVASVLNSYAKRVEVEPLVRSIIEPAMTAEYTTTSKGLVTHIKINLGSDHITLHKKRR